MAKGNLEVNIKVNKGVLNRLIRENISELLDFEVGVEKEVKVSAKEALEEAEKVYSEERKRIEGLTGLSTLEKECLIGDASMALEPFQDKILDEKWAKENDQEEAIKMNDFKNTSTALEFKLNEMFHKDADSYKYITIDSDGEVRAWVNKPRTDNSYWYAEAHDEESTLIGDLSQSDDDFGDWRETLQEIVR